MGSPGLMFTIIIIDQLMWKSAHCFIVCRPDDLLFSAEVVFCSQEGCFYWRWMIGSVTCLHDGEHLPQSGVLFTVCNLRKGVIWICCRTGAFVFAAENFVERADLQPVLKQLSGIAEKRNEHVFAATPGGRTIPIAYENGNASRIQYSFSAIISR